MPSGFESFSKVEPIAKGWSGDQKYRAETLDGKRMLLRVSDIAEYGRKRAAYERMARAYGLGGFAPQPLGFGLCDGGKSCYALSAWIDGNDAEIALPRMSQAEQYTVGRNAGETLRRIHTLPVPKNIPEWGTRYFGIMDKRLAAFRLSGIRVRNDWRILAYLDGNRCLLQNRPQCFRHGDYSAGNLMVADKNNVYVVDWEADDFDNSGDPWLDFTDVVWGADVSPHFASGVIHGYFSGNPPYAFWERLMFYVFFAILPSIQWVAEAHGLALENEIRLYEAALAWFENTKNPVPTWYLKDFHIQSRG